MQSHRQLMQKVFGVLDECQELISQFETSVIQDLKSSIGGTLDKMLATKDGTAAGLHDHNPKVRIAAIKLLVLFWKVKPSEALSKAIDLMAKTDSDAEVRTVATTFSTLITFKPEKGPFFQQHKGFENFSKGLEAFQDGMFDKAIEEFTHAILVQSTAGGAYQMRARSYLKVAQTNKALEDFARALEIDPFAISVYLERAKVYEQMGLVDRSEDDVRQADALRRMLKEEEKARGHSGFPVPPKKQKES